MPSHNMHPYGAPEHEEEDEASLPAGDPEADEKPGSPDLKAGSEPKAQEAAENPEEKAKAEIEDMRLRMAAEMDNFKKRLTREHQEQMRYASEKVLAELLPALDNLDLAIQFGSTHEACKEMMQGIELTRRQLLEALEKNGLVAVGDRGEPFDPAKHEAIGIEADPEIQPGGVSKVLQRGYKLNDRLLRPAKVMVTGS